ncbi:FAD binding domain-containing protein, partial [Paracoccus nototheniae]
AGPPHAGPLHAGTDRAIIPCDTDDLAQALLAEPQATLVAGATDVGLWVTKFMRDISPAIFIGHLMKEIAVTDDMLELGAGVTYSEAAPLIARHIPEAHDYWLRIGGWQVRNMGTIGANIANGSPIGDTPPLLIALGARIVLRRGDVRRTLALEDFFLDYGRQDRAPGEFVERILVPLRPTARSGARAGTDSGADAAPGPRTLIAAYKITKRRDSDITAVAAGFCLQVHGGIITEARLAFGGMAATPKRAAGAEAALRGQPFTQASFEAAARAVDGDFQPLSDMRASAAYRATVARNLFRRFWLEQGAGADPDRPVRLNHAVPQALRQAVAAEAPPFPGAEAPPSLKAGE